MATASPPYLATGQVGNEGSFTTSDEMLATLQKACGGRLGGQLAIPELRDLVGKACEYRLRLSRRFSAMGAGERFTGWVDVVPHDGEPYGGTIHVINLTVEQVADNEDDAQAARIRRDLIRALPDFVARLAPDQTVLTADAQDSELEELAASMRSGGGKPWTDFVVFSESLHDQPLHWRLLDGSTCTVPGSGRSWTTWLEPLGVANPGSEGFVLTFVSDTPPPVEQPVEDAAAISSLPALTQELAAALRQPINRIMDNAETIQVRLAGPLAEIYSGYGTDMVGAAEHLGALLDDIVDVEMVEASDLPVQLETLDLGAAARQACGILGGKAQDRDISLVPPVAGDVQRARGDYRRVLQILINLIGNAIAYAPEESQVWIRLDETNGHATITVADQGRGLTPDEQGRVFDKFERLGRKGDGGSGLGLYIARHLAEAMSGSLKVESAPGQGARFTLALPPAG